MTDNRGDLQGQGHKLTWFVRLISASSSFGKQNAAVGLLVLLEAGGGIPCRPNPMATLLVILPSLRFTDMNRRTVLRESTNLSSARAKISSKSHLRFESGFPD